MHGPREKASQHETSVKHLAKNWSRVWTENEGGGELSELFFETLAGCPLG